MNIYIDEFLLINISINFLILHITKIILKSDVSFKKLIITSIIGALYAVMIFIPQTSFLTGIIGKLIFSLLITKISFKHNNLKQYLYNMVTFYSVTFTIGGCGYAIFNLASDSGKINTTILLTTTSIISYLLINFINEIYEKFFKMDTLKHNITIHLNDNIVEAICYFDTCNNLKDPIKKLPVVVIDLSLAEKLFQKDFIETILNNNLKSAYLTYSSVYKLSIIPFNTIGGDGFLIGFTPNKTYIDNKEVNVTIAITTAKLSADNEYNAILNPQLIF